MDFNWVNTASIRTVDVAVVSAVSTADSNVENIQSFLFEASNSIISLNLKLYFMRTKMLDLSNTLIFTPMR